ncbi:MAG TPA: DUF3999 family protein [Candidatus Acidoferrum sp.]|nr:DUF3999 family protein [Candidatus Acidoferrum sp.]
MISRSKTGPRRGWMAACALLALGFTVAAVPLPSAWKNWRYWRAIDLAPTDTERLATIVVPNEVFRWSRTTLPDLRIIDDGGAEVGYATRIREGSVNNVPTPTTVVEKSFAPGNYTQLVLNLGAAPPFHNAVEIQTAETDFIEWVSIEASDDARVWRIVQPRAPFFRFHLQYHEGAQVVPYSENNARYLRIRILDKDKAFAATGATVYHKTETEAERVPFAAAFAPGTPSDPKRSAWITDFGGLGAPVSEASFEVAGPAEFIRTVEMFGSDDGIQWYRFTQGEIYRYTVDETTQQHLSVQIPFGGAQGRFWKVEVDNADDPPLSGVTLHLYTRPRHVYFEQQPGRSYRLIYGRGYARSPEYDLARRLEATREQGAVTGRVGPEQENSAYTDPHPEPWTEKNRFVLWIVVGIAAILLGYSAIQSLRRSASTPQSNA